jgi:hypothetical protein
MFYLKDLQENKMAKQETLKNQYDGESTQLDKYDKKYFKFMQDFQNKTALAAFDSFRTKDLTSIENTLRQLAFSITSNAYIMGIGYLIIEREKLYIKAGYSSYFEYIQYLMDDSELPYSTICNAKIIVEKLIDYNRQLMNAGFRLEKNGSKLLHLDEALKNHSEDEVYRHIVDDTYRKFKDWAHRQSLIDHKPEKDVRVDAEIKGDKLLIDGKNVLNFPKGLSADVRDLIREDLQKTFSIREGGNQPYIVSTYGKAEQTAIDNLLKKTRSKK